jgi:uncharacterized protein YcnI
MMRAALIAVIVLAAASTARAHVTVWPQQSQAGGSERYTVRVPTEGQVATTSVELEIPAGMTVSAVLVGGVYTYDVRREANRIVAITWTLDIKPAETAEFVFFARNPNAQQVTWKARQRLADGTSVDWVGVEGDRRPAAVTKLVPGR